MRGNRTRLWRPCRTAYLLWRRTLPETRDLVVDDVTGRLISATKADSERRRATFAKHTQQLLEAPELAAQMGAAGKARMETEFSVEKMVAAHAELYRELLQ